MSPHTTDNVEDADDIELSLLDEEDRRRAARGLEETEEGGRLKSEDVKQALTFKEKRAVALLIVLYLIQGVPVGLAMGSMPFLLREHLSYSQLGVFALSTYPYSLKLFWSPIVDSFYFVRIGRRKSWIIPMQIIIGTLMFYISFNVQLLVDQPDGQVYHLTAIFTLLVFFASTQDIAVDGWAITLFSRENLSYASLCQTIGLNTGFFASYTVFLAFNSVEFTQKWNLPLLTLSTYLRFWGLTSYSVTLWLTLFETEAKESAEEIPIKISSVYLTIWKVCKLKHIQALMIMYVFAVVGQQADDSVTPLKMVEKGLGREDLAFIVLIDFPCQIIGGWVAAIWSRGDKPLRPWAWGFLPVYGFVVLDALIVYWFPRPPVTKLYIAFLVVINIISSFVGTMQFVSQSTFHTRIADPLIGGTYMTLLATFVNLGRTWPKFFVLKAVDLLTVANCRADESASAVLIKAVECVSEQGQALCTEAGGHCILERDGYYWVSGICLTFGLAFFLGYIIPTAHRLQALPLSQWHVDTK